ncbi:hypothetical protein HMPREF0183_1742 [Brevibacterium mcbrellneri ATCC 49030]|uniref:Uncharacterized protein n=1 Tax=Brevibacterium mcbrellneri ATCC 49030 TaxID=585530 RepID=D4YP82_9MICO|nr:hypothetical protein HMPREF0183_1742 [Brevibacterium mcbrellneri ATCC 49030]
MGKAPEPGDVFLWIVSFPWWRARVEVARSLWMPEVFPQVAEYV